MVMVLPVGQRASNGAWRDMLVVCTYSDDVLKKSKKINMSRVLGVTSGV
jgi:hypothetical protein